MISEVIKTRRSIFPAQYNDQHISEEEILAILAAANWAPTHKKTEPWRFKVFHSEEKRAALGDFLSNTYKVTASKVSEFKSKKIIQKALTSKCIIAICMQRDPEERIPEWEEIASTAMAVQNMWLTAHQLNIGAYWSSPAYSEHLGAHVSLNEGEYCLGFFYMGKYDRSIPKGERKSGIEEKTQWI